MFFENLKKNSSRVGKVRSGSEVRGIGSEGLWMGSYMVQKVQRWVQKEVEGFQRVLKWVQRGWYGFRLSLFRFRCGLKLRKSGGG